MKKCSKCQQLKEYIGFCKNKRYIDGYHDTCKVCRKVYNIKNKEKIKQYYNNTKEKQTLQYKQYYKNNKDIIKQYIKQYYNNNKEKIKQTHIKYNQNPKIKEKHLDNIKKWFVNNPNYGREYASNRYKNDINFKLKSNLKSRFYHAINNENKVYSINKLLGCSINELKQYIENQFKPEMDWDNHGEIWEMDHIIGCCSFDLNKLEEQKKCFHYTNLQPLFKTSRIAKDFGYINEIGNRDKNKK